ncbi:hypothetical protein M405DRAFT_870129 [Rhizopogon salebrosus TDB-379]|nr:hypothetical protein M405DRAFT_870129 [Rhizopogon salebrosus TDB-379]
MLRKVCNATGKPEIFDGKGNKINADVGKPSVDICGRGFATMTKWGRRWIKGCLTQVAGRVMYHVLVL